MEQKRSRQHHHEQRNKNYPIEISFFCMNIRHKKFAFKKKVKY